MSVRVLFVKTGHMGQVSDKVSRILIAKGEAILSWDRPEVPAVPAAMPAPKKEVSQ